MLVEAFTTDTACVTPPAQSNHPLIDRLSKFVTLGAEERAAIEALTRTRRTFGAEKTLVCEGRDPEHICLILSGAAFRYRFLPNGRRQIFGYLLPGDLCDTQFVISNESDHNVGLLCDTEVAIISPSALMTAMVAYPKIERALLTMSLVDAAIMREWLLNIAQHDAPQKLAHFFCELGARFRAVGNDDSVVGTNIPLTQGEVADTLGLTIVHVNRVMQRFRREGLLNWSRRHFDVLDYPRLQRLAGFDPTYLRLDVMPSEPRMSAYG